MSMTLGELETAIADAQRFIERAKTLKRTILSEAIDQHLSPSSDQTKRLFLYGPSPDNSAVRRASMELTRSLARLRKPG